MDKMNIAQEGFSMAPVASWTMILLLIAVSVILAAIAAGNRFTGITRADAADAALESDEGPASVRPVLTLVPPLTGDEAVEVYDWAKDPGSGLVA